MQLKKVIVNHVAFYSKFYLAYCYQELSEKVTNEQTLKLIQATQQIS